MKITKAVCAALACAALWAPVAQAQIVGPLPFTLTNGTTADANQVMSNLNYISSQVNTNVGNTITAQINATVPALIASAVLTALPVGTVVDWSGSVASIPSPWQLCDGTNSTPNLKDKFLVGAGNAYAVGATGGQTNVTPTITVNGTSLSVAQLPSYSLTVTDPGHAHGITDPGHTHAFTAGTASITGNIGYTTGASAAPTTGTVANSMSSATTGITVNTATTGISVSSGGSGTAHSHSATSSLVSTLPPYYALAKICKTS